MPPGRLAHRVREVAIAAHACQVGHGPWFCCGSEDVLRPTLAVRGRVWPFWPQSVRYMVPQGAVESATRARESLQTSY